MLAKETRLSDDAQIYQPRDTRSEKEKFKEMTFQEKVQHFNQYYRSKLILLVLIIGFGSYLLYSMFGPKVKTVLYTAIVDGCIDTETAQAFETEMTKRLNLDPKKYNVTFDDSYYLTTGGELDVSNQQKLSCYIVACDVDIIIAPEKVFQQYCSDGYFAKLSDTLPTNLFGSLTDQFFYATVTDSTSDDNSKDASVEDTEESAYGIYLDSYNIKDTNGNILVRPVLGILVNSKQKENAVTYIKTLNLH